MTDLLEKAIATVRTLAPQIQDDPAEASLAEVSTAEAQAARVRRR